MNKLNELMAEVMGWRDGGDFFLDGENYWVGYGADSVFTGMKHKDWNPSGTEKHSLGQAMMCAEKSKVNIIIELNHLDDDKPHSVECEDIGVLADWTDLSGLAKVICSAIVEARKG